MADDPRWFHVRATVRTTRALLDRALAALEDSGLAELVDVHVHDLDHVDEAAPIVAIDNAGHAFAIRR